MSSDGHSEASLHPSHLSELSNILRHANRRYSEIAIQVRDSLHLTHHARKRAAALRLRVSIRCARGLDPKQISHIPLPVLEVTPPPFELSKAVVGREREMARLSRDTAIRIPARLPQASIHSMSKRDSRDVINADTDELYSSGSDYSDEGMELPFSIEHSPCLTPSLTHAVIKPAKPPLRLDLPEDIMWYSWGLEADDLSSMSDGTGSSMSTGLQTPPDEMPKLTLSIKRKSYGADIDMEADCLEKRPKYERKEWIIPASRRTVQRTNCSRK